jgi:hypothetical protein
MITAQSFRGLREGLDALPMSKTGKLLAPSRQDEIIVLYLCAFASLREVIRVSGSFSNPAGPLRLEAFSPQLGEEPLLHQLLNQAVVEELIRLDVLCFRIIPGNLIESHLERLRLD